MRQKVRMINTQVLVYKKNFYKKVRGISDYCRFVVKTAYGTTAKNVEISLVLADDGFIKELNSHYRQKDSPTNVLTFEMNEKLPDNTLMAGEIIISYETLAKEAKEQGKTFLAHLTHLLIHGVLHLKGMDHIIDSQAEKMEQREIALLKKLGFPNPYANQEVI